MRFTTRTHGFWIECCSFFELFDLLWPYNQEQHTTFREALPITIIVASVEHELAKGVDNVVLSFIFAHWSCTLKNYMLLICHVLASRNKLSNKYMNIQ